MPHNHWIEILQYSVDVYSETDSLLEVLGRLHDLDAARAAYGAAVRKCPDKRIMLRWKAQVLRRSDRPA